MKLLPPIQFCNELYGVLFLNDIKQLILRNLCYTDLVYSRINKKLELELSRTEIEEHLHKALNETDATEIKKRGKNYYANCRKYNMRITINSNTFRVITVDRFYRKIGGSHAKN